MESLSLSLAPLALFMFVSSITPGPNNLMLLNSGIRFGFGRTVPHMLGITAGLVGLLLVAYAGVATLLLACPALLKLMTIACCAYLLWLATALLKDDGAGAADRAGQRPMAAYQAALFQFVNPKAWAMAVTACAIATRFPLPGAAALPLTLLICAAINLPCVSVWALFGKSLRGFLHRAVLRQAFNFSMAALVAATAVWLLLPVMAQGGDAAMPPPLSIGR
jgi:threonine/homoserine/homoserine lactone efflux protein